MDETSKFILIYWVIIVIAWFFHNFATIKIAKRIGLKTTWPVWIPFFGKWYIYAKMANKPWWTIILAPIFFIFIPIAGTVLICYWYWYIAQRIKLSGWWILLAPLSMFIWAFESEKEFKQRMSKPWPPKKKIEKKKPSWIKH